MNIVYKDSVAVLDIIVANQMVLLVQTLNYHWNVEGKEFHDYHILLNKQYAMLFDQIDLIAERIRALGAHAPVCMSELIRNATLQEDASKKVAAREMIVRLVQQYQKQIETIRHAITTLEKSSDYGTRKMLEDIIEVHEKTFWMLQALLVT